MYNNTYVESPNSRVILTEQSPVQDIEWWILRLRMMVNIRINMIRIRKMGVLGLLMGED